MIFLTHISPVFLLRSAAMKRKKAEIWNRTERIKITQWVILANEPACAKNIFRFNQKSQDEFLKKML
jgi:hypothetical protein